MKTKAPAVQMRIVVAASLLAAALISSIVITKIGNTSQEFWVASRSISPGEVIAAADVSKSSVSLKSSSALYLSRTLSPVGMIAVRSIGQAELIAQSAIGVGGEITSSEIVPLHLSISDIPGDISVGEEVAIYWVPEAMGSQVIGDPQLVLRGIFLRSVDRKNSNFGNDVAITVSVDSSEVISLLSATSSGRLVIVRARG
ncbi:unannotated protein [freshwater metagenome]|uniref:Unannotated protein n=1 Tax=freshwater metagenome TaxID=449393 RepID=A0A6J7DK34_9ZZZZ|nr:hypothetical protein [Actinomycetota bacterium]